MELVGTKPLQTRTANPPLQPIQLGDLGAGDLGVAGDLGGPWGRTGGPWGRATVTY